MRPKVVKSALSSREAQRRLLQYGPNEIERRTKVHWPQDLARQFVHPLALLLWAAALLAAIAGITAIAGAIVAVIFLNAGFAFWQERQAENAVEALARYIPEHSMAMRDGQLQDVEARFLVPGDILFLQEGDNVSADARILEGLVEANMSALTGESSAVLRSSKSNRAASVLESSNNIFSGTTILSGECWAEIWATGMHSQLGRIAALSERVKSEPSPLEEQVRKVAWLIAGVAVGLGLAFMPIAMIFAGLGVTDSTRFAIGLLVGNVPEGLLPVITLALAVGVRELARRGAVMKRLSAVETLGSTTTICTDKTGTLTLNQMSVVEAWHAGKSQDDFLRAMSLCSTAHQQDGQWIGDPTETALTEYAQEQGGGIEPQQRSKQQLACFSFNAELKRMSTVDKMGPHMQVHCKGAPEVILPLCTSQGSNQQLTQQDIAGIKKQVGVYAKQGLRVLAVAQRNLDGQNIPQDRQQVEQDLCLLGLVAMEDPPRHEVKAAVKDCQAAGIRVIVVTGDHPDTAVAIARQVGIIDQQAPLVFTGDQAEAMVDHQLGEQLASLKPIVFARSSPQTKLRIADLLKEQQEVVAMTGDGANDAPALRAADIGIAMGISGTDVAREASTMVLTDDNFATIVDAIRAGRRVFNNVRKFIFYIFAHATPEVAPFLLFALSGGAVPLPLTIPQLLAVDVGTETLPALALGREPAEPGIMHRKPRSRREGVIQGSMLIRAWLFVGLISAVLELSGFFFVLLQHGWQLGDDTSAGTALHHPYLQATTMTFAGMVMCQVGTAFAARTERASLRSVGVFKNHLLLWGILFEIVLTAMIIYIPFLQDIFATAALGPQELLFLLPFPFIVWGCDELRRWLLRCRYASEPNALAS